MTNCNDTSSDFQRAVGAFVDREVIHNVSCLVSALAAQNEEHWDLFWAFDADRADELVLAAMMENPDTLATLHGLDFDEPDDLKEALHRLGIDPAELQTEVLEYWIVTGWLADKLEAKGERVERNFYGLTLWGRCCTGQAILLDRVIRDIHDEAYGHKGTPPETPKAEG